MRLKKVIATIAPFYLLIVTACQKSASGPAPQAPGSDSVSLIKIITSVNYDDQGRFVFLARGIYDYSNFPQKIAVAVRDSDSYEIKDIVETYLYDSKNRLSEFTSTSSQWANKIDFQYNGSSQLTKATTSYPNGNIIVNTFQYQTVNGLNVIKMYDTANINYGGSLRPRTVTVSLDDSNRIVKYVEASTFYPDSPRLWYLDTSVVAAQYASNGDAVKAVFYDSYFNGFGFVRSSDSVIYTHENKGVELLTSFLNISRNIYWFSLSEDGAGFSESALQGTSFFYYWKYPVAQIQHWSTGSAFQPSSTGLFQNTFNAAGQLTHALYPPGFGSKYGGKSVFDYTYTKLKL